jgi:hypothetical protein
LQPNAGFSFIGPDQVQPAKPFDWSQMIFCGHFELFQ